MRYKVILRDEAGWDTIAWCYSFDTKAGQVRLRLRRRVTRSKTSRNTHAQAGAHDHRNHIPFACAEQ